MDTQIIGQGTTECKCTATHFGTVGLPRATNAHWVETRIEQEEIERTAEYIAEHDAWFASLDWRLEPGREETKRAFKSMRELDAAEVAEEMVEE